MSNIKCLTNRDLKGQNPLYPSSDFFGDFVLLNMGPGEGIWYVDKQLPQFTECLKAAIAVAETFGDTRTVEKLTALLN